MLTRFVALAPSEIPLVEASHDVRGGGTGREFKENLIMDGTEVWNKWYSNNRGPWILTFTFAAAQSVVGYSVQAANDCPGRDPREWSVFDAGTGHPMHAVSHETFSERWKTKFYLFEVPIESLGVKFVVKDSLEGNECQIGHIKFLVVDKKSL